MSESPPPRRTSPGGFTERTASAAGRIKLLPSPLSRGRHEIGSVCDPARTSIVTWNRSLLHRHLAVAVVVAAVLAPPVSAFDFKKVTLGIGWGPNKASARDPGIAYLPGPAVPGDSVTYVYALRPFDRHGSRYGESIHLHMGYQVSVRSNIEFSALGNLQRFSDYVSTAPGVHMTLLHVTANFNRRIGREPGPWFTTGGFGYGFDPTYRAPNGPALSAGLGRRLGHAFDVRLIADWVVHMQDPDVRDYQGERTTVALLIGLAHR